MGRTRWRKPRVTMVWRASVADVVSRVTMGFGVIMALTGVIRGSIPSPTTFRGNGSAWISECGQH